MTSQTAAAEVIPLIVSISIIDITAVGASHVFVCVQKYDSVYSDDLVHNLY